MREGVRRVGVVVVSIPAVHGGGVGGEGVLGGVHTPTQVTREAFRLYCMLVEDVRLEVVLVADHLVAVRTDARRV